MSTIEVVFLCILILGLISVVIWFSLTYRDYKDCQDNESTFCPKIVCGNDASTTDPACKGALGNTAFAPYRKDSSGVIMCQMQPTAEVIYPVPV